MPGVQLLWRIPLAQEFKGRWATYKYCLKLLTDGTVPAKPALLLLPVADEARSHPHRFFSSALTEEELPQAYAPQIPRQKS